MSVPAAERLTELRAADLEELVRESEAEGFAFLRRLEVEWRSGANRFDRPGELLLGARSAPAAPLVAVCGLNVDPFAKDPAVGRLRHLYVGRAQRRRGLGARLVRLALEAAYGRFVRVRLRTENPEAARLYEALGFRAVAEPDATHALRLEARPKGA